MNLKSQISLNLSVTFTIILGVVLAVVYFSFYKFRKDEFKENLENSALITANYISRFPEDQLNADSDSITNVRNSVEDNLFKEKVLVFDGHKKLIFSNISNGKVEWNPGKLKQLDEKSKIYWLEKKHENIGLKTVINGEAFYIFTEAEDVNGNAKLDFLKIMLLSVYLIGVGFLWIFSYFFMRKQLKPLDEFKDRIVKLSAQELNVKMEERKTNDEINVLIRAFNSMIAKLDHSFQRQKEFTSSASHEIKTPLTRMAFQLENLKKESVGEENREKISLVQKEVYHLSDTVESLLLLSKIEENASEMLEEVRMDEVIFEGFEQVRRNEPDFEMDFEILKSPEEGNLSVRGVKSLLKIVFVNMLKNAVAYSEKPKVKIEVEEEKDHIAVRILNKGELISDDEIDKIFNAFNRGSNSRNTSGSGLGLRIAKRILDFHHAEIRYESQIPDLNIFTITFPTT